MSLENLDLKKFKSDIPQINVQNPAASEETYYGKFRSIVKQRYFGIKLEEDPFMEFLESNQDVKDQLTTFITFMARVKGEYINFLKKTYPEKLEKRKKKRKGKKKDILNTLDVPGGSEAFSSDYSANLSTSRDETEGGGELQILKSKIEAIKKDFCFDSVENVAKNIHLFDDVFGKLKAEHTKNQQLNQLRQLGLNFEIGSGAGGLSFAFGGSTANNQQAEPDIPSSFEYFQELYKRWDIACAETGVVLDYEGDME